MKKFKKLGIFITIWIGIYHRYLMDEHLKLTILILTVFSTVFLFSHSALGAYYDTGGNSFTSMNIGNTTYFSGGLSGTAMKIGGTTYYNVGGKNYTTMDIGGTTYFSGDLSGTAMKIGGTTYYNVGGKNYTAMDIGGTTYFSGDVSGTAMRAGGTTYYNNYNSNNSLLNPTYSFNVTAKDSSDNKDVSRLATIAYNLPESITKKDIDEEKDISQNIKTQIAGFSSSRQDQIKNFYQDFFNRIPETIELDYWVNVKGYSLNEIKKAFYNSNEYNKKIKNLANKQGKKKGIEKLFQDIFGRAIKKNDLEYWSKQDTSILGIKFLFLNSKEYKANSEDKQSTERRNQIASLYRGILMRPPDQNGLNYWDKTKKPLKQIRTTMLNSAEFKNLLETLEKQKGREAAFEQLFEAVFNSPADGKNHNYYVQKNKGINLQKAKAELMQSKRYQKQSW